MKISLYDCFNAHVLGEDIYCSKGHELGGRPDGKVFALWLEKGKPLVFTACQDCLDFDRMGEPVKPEDRDWNKQEVE